MLDGKVKRITNDRKLITLNKTKLRRHKKELQKTNTENGKQ